MKPDRPYFFVWIALPAFGRVGPWSTGTDDRKTANRMEAWLREIVLTRPEVVEGIVDGHYSFRDAWVSKLRGDRVLDSLVQGREDPPLSDAITRARKVVTDSRALTGLDHLEAWAPKGMNLSALDATQIQLFYASMRSKMAPASIYRGPHRAVRELLNLEMGGVRTDATMRDVKVPKQETAREVSLTPDEVKRLVQSAPNDRFRWMVTLAILTTADRKPLLNLTPRHYDNEAGELRVPDTKTASRPRTVRLPKVGQAILRLATAGAKPSERLFPWTKWQVRKLWDKTRENAELEHVRFKDLRHLLPTLLAAWKVDRREIQALMGHAPGSRITDRYITPAGDVPTLDKAAEHFGLSHLEAS